VSDSDVHHAGRRPAGTARHGAVAAAQDQPAAAAGTAGKAAAAANSKVGTATLAVAAEERAEL
jgi:hypothetical protein